MSVPVAPLGQAPEDAGMPARRTRTASTTPVARASRRPSATRATKDLTPSGRPQVISGLLRATQLAFTITGVKGVELADHLHIKQPSILPYLTGTGANDYLLTMAHVLSSFHALATMTIDGVERVVPLEDPDPESLAASEQRVLTMFSAFSNTPVALDNYANLRERFTQDSKSAGTVAVAHLDEVITREITGRDIKPYLLCLNTGIHMPRATELSKGIPGQRGMTIYQIWDALRIGITIRIQRMTYKIGNPGPLPTSAAELGPIRTIPKRK